MANKDAGIENYSVIFLGSSIRWYAAPTIINPFLENYDFSGKRIVLSVASGISSFGGTMGKLKSNTSPSAEIVGAASKRQTVRVRFDGKEGDFGC